MREYKLWIGRLLSIAGVVGLFVALTILFLGGDLPSMLIALAMGALGFAGWFLLAPADVLSVLGGRQLRYGAFGLISSALFIGVLALVYTLATRSEVSVDFTETQRFTLSNASKEALSGLETSIHITGFYSSTNIQAQENATVLLRQYNQATGGLVTYEFVDLNDQPTLATAYGATRDGMLFAQREDDPPEMAERIAFLDEREITRAILKLVKSGDFKVYFTIGHGEYDINSAQGNGLQTLNQALREVLDIETDELNLLGGPIPEDASAIVVAGAITRFLPEEVDLLSEYLANGGRLMLMADPPLPPGQQQFMDEEDPLAALLWEDHGVRFREDVVISTNTLDSPFSPFGDRIISHEITQNLQQRPPIFLLARSIEKAETRSSGVLALDLIYSAPEDYGETNFDLLLENPPSFREDPEDHAGSPVLVSVVQANIDQPDEMRMVLVGDSNFATNDMARFPGNTMLFADAIDWLIDYSAEIEIEVVSDTTQLPLVLGANQSAIIGFLTILVMPAAVLAIWLVVWWNRQQG